MSNDTLEAWTIDETGYHIYSDDFTHDAMLTVSGDFGTKEDRINYTKAICDKLNSQSIPKERLLEWLGNQKNPFGHKDARARHTGGGFCHAINLLREAIGSMEGKG